MISSSARVEVRLRRLRAVCLAPLLFAFANVAVAADDDAAAKLAAWSQRPTQGPAAPLPPRPLGAGCTAGQPQSFSYTGQPIAIPDGADLSGTLPGAPVDAIIAVAGVTGPIFDVDISVDGTVCSATAGSTTVGIDHTFVNDLELTLISPANTQVLIVNNTDGSGNNFCQTALSDESAGVNIQTVLAADNPFTGSFVPAAALTAFDTESANGNWILRAQDFFSQDTGNIRAYTVTITPAVCPLSADLAITKVGLASPGSIVYTVSVTNNGPDNATNVAVSDNLPAALAYVSDTCGGTGAPAWTWTIGALANGATATCDITLNVVTPGQVLNTASASATEADPTPANNSATATNVVAGQPPVLVEVPTLGGVGMAVLALAIAVASFVMLRRRRAV